MQFITFSIGALGGSFLTSFTIIPILIIFFFAFPATRKLNKLNYLEKNNLIIKKYLFSVFLLSTIFLIITKIIFVIFSGLASGYFFGIIIALFLGLGKYGANQSNITDYVKFVSKYLKVKPEEAIKAIIYKNKFNQIS